MADHDKKEEVSKCYQKLMKETFEGTHVGTYDLSDATSKIWYKIKIEPASMSSAMKKGLKAIEDSFENCIWKGFKDGVMYVNKEQHDDWKSIEEAEKFKIKDFKVMDFDKCKKPDRYTYKFGCCFILEAA